MYSSAVDPGDPTRHGAPTTLNKQPQDPLPTYPDTSQTGNNKNTFEPHLHAIHQLATQFADESKQSLSDLDEKENGQFTNVYSTHDTNPTRSQGNEGKSCEIPYNPFIDTFDPILDPHSDDFSSFEWAKFMLRVRQNDPETYPSFSAGVSFKSLGAYGYTDSTSYQKTVLNVLHSKLNNFYSFLTRRKGSKTIILKDFNGLVKSGETCVVLGRPGA